MTQGTLLPGNRTPFETAVSLTSATRHPLPTHLVTSVFNPDTCPTDLLGWLANSLSIDIWDDAWPETTKREACRNALKLHRLKTTPAGVKLHVKQAGSEVLKIVRPPARGFMYPAMTEAQRSEWLDGLPQVRIYPYFRRKVGVTGRYFYSGPGGRKFHVLRRYEVGDMDGWSATALGIPQSTDAIDAPTSWPLSPLGRPQPVVVQTARVITAFMRPTRGFNLYGRRATYYVDGVETDVAYEGASFGDNIERVFIGRASKRSFLAAGRHERFGQKSVGSEFSLTLRLSEDSPQKAVPLGGSVVDVRPERISQRRTPAAARGFFGQLIGGRAPRRFLRTSFAPLLIYDRISINDPTRTVARRKARNYMGFSRFGIAPFTAEVTIRVPMIRTRRRSGRWHRAGFMKRADMSRLNMAIEAIRVSKAFRDTVLINTTTYATVTLADRPRLGQFRLGEQREVI